MSGIPLHPYDTTAPSVLGNNFAFLFGYIISPKSELNLYHFFSMSRFPFFYS
jgi:hypothetical protein